MQDIGKVLNVIMQTEQCSSIYALFLLLKKEGDENGLYKLQPESKTKISR